MRWVILRRGGRRVRGLPAYNTYEEALAALRKCGIAFGRCFIKAEFAR